MDTRDQQVRTWSMLCHISALAGILFSLGSVLGPLLVWQLKKNELPEVEAHGKAAVNFQLTVLIVNVIGWIVMSVTIGFSALLFSPFSALGSGLGIGSVLALINLVAYILAVMAGIRANDGRFYKYPFSITFVR